MKVLISGLLKHKKILFYIFEEPCRCRCSKSIANLENRSDTSVNMRHLSFPVIDQNQCMLHVTLQRNKHERSKHNDTGKHLFVASKSWFGWLAETLRCSPKTLPCQNNRSPLKWSWLLCPPLYNSIKSENSHFSAILSFLPAGQHMMRFLGAHSHTGF